MIIKCPHCGPREASEYTYVGDATIIRPDHDDTNIDKWNDYVFMRENPRGNHMEHWQHTSGCRAFIKVVRNTVSHEISNVSLEGPWQSEDKS
jgi:methylglutamate dehydrogenase subunit B